MHYKRKSCQGSLPLHPVIVIMVLGLPIYWKDVWFMSSHYNLLLTYIFGYRAHSGYGAYWLSHV